MKLCKLLKDKYGGDARNLRAENEQDPIDAVRTRVQEFNGIGKMFWNRGSSILQVALEVISLFEAPKSGGMSSSLF